jgi:Ala-tRNA(Pro) deacylase
MSIPRTLIDCLNTNKIPYEILPHAVAFTARTAAATEHIASHYQAKVVMVGSEKGPVMTVLPADRKLDLRKVGRLTQTRAVLQSEAEFAPVFPDCERGAMPPFGNLYGLPTYVDQHLAEEDYIVFEAGTYTEAIKINYCDYERAVKPQVADLVIDHCDDWSLWS